MQKKEIKQIGEEVTKAVAAKLEPQFKRIREDFAQVIEYNINPQFDEVRGRLDGVENRLSRVESQMVTKSYLDDKMAELEGGLVVKLRKEDIKMNRLIEIMKKKSLLSKSEVKELNEFKIFPKISN